MMLKPPHKSFVFKCQDCDNGCGIWLIRDHVCGRWGEACSQEYAIFMAVNHFIRHHIVLTIQGVKYKRASDFKKRWVPIDEV